MQRRFKMLSVLSVLMLALTLPAFGSDAAASVSGEVIEVNVSDASISVEVPMEGGKKTVVLKVSGETKITRDAKPIPLGDIRSGETISASYIKQDGALHARSIEVS